jgi:hypothetical protein
MFLFRLYGNEKNDKNKERGPYQSSSFEMDISTYSIFKIWSTKIACDIALPSGKDSKVIH